MGQKRANGSDDIRDIKRLKLVIPKATEEIPRLDRGDVRKPRDFTLFAQRFAEDITISNGEVEFEAHKAILGSISSWFRDIFDGDVTVVRLTLPISSDAMIWLQKKIYAKPRSRYDTDCDLEISLYEDFVLLITKYDIQIVKKLYDRIHPFRGSFATLQIESIFV